MRVHMRVQGQAVSVRGSITKYDPPAGLFSVTFDKGVLVGPDGSVVNVVDFRPNGPDSVTDTVWDLVWFFIS